MCIKCIFYLQSGLLISVIRALSASETNEQRDTEKAKLEKEYKRSDQRLEELVSSHDQDLMEVMQVNRCIYFRSTNVCNHMYHIHCYILS